MPQRGHRVRVPERFQPLAGRLRTEPDLAGSELGDGVEQRPVEELLVQPADHRSVPFPGPVEFVDRFGAQPERASEAAQIGFVVGHQMRTPQPEQLDVVLHGPQEAVRLVELRRVGPADVAAGRELPQGDEGAAAAQRGVVAAVHQLEELYGEFDVPQPAGAELQLTVDMPDGDVVDDPAAHLLHVGHEVLPVGGLPDHR